MDIFDDQGRRRYGFCALASSDGLESLWFSVPQGASAPQGAHVEVVDRACGNIYVSNAVSLELHAGGRRSNARWGSGIAVAPPGGFMPVALPASTPRFISKKNPRTVGRQWVHT